MVQTQIITWGHKMKVLSKVMPKVSKGVGVEGLLGYGGGGPVCNGGIVINGCFEEDLAGWTPYQWEWQAPGRAAPIHVSSNTLQQTIPMELGDDIVVRFDYHLESGATLYVKLGNPAGINDIVIAGPADDTYIGVEVATGDTIQFAITGAATLDDWVDNVGVIKKEWYPDQFQFVDKDDVDPNTLTTSDPVEILGMDADCPVQVTDGEYDVNISGTWLTDESRIQPGDLIRVRRLSGDFDTSVSVVFQAGRSSDTFNVTTRSASTAPDPFDIPDQTDVAQDTAITSAVVSPTGLEVDATITVVGGLYQLNGAGGFVSTPSTFSPGDTFEAQVQSSTEYATETECTVDIGGESSMFKVVTIPETGMDYLYDSDGNIMIDSDGNPVLAP